MRMDRDDFLLVQKKQDKKWNSDNKMMKILWKIWWRCRQTFTSYLVSHNSFSKYILLVFITGENYFLLVGLSVSYSGYWYRVHTHHVRTYRVFVYVWEMCNGRIMTFFHYLLRVFRVPGILFERSEFLIDTPHKKNLRVCPRARVK